MCGIAGFLSFDGKPASRQIAEAMGAAIAHRGPDGSGTFLDGSLGLSHRRLSIIDLSKAGHQPMEAADGRYALVYNGEIYNYLELRRELEAGFGYIFQSRTDTEVLLAALICWGEEAVLKLNGIFAFAFWDAQEKRLLLVRDRYGAKPLYWREDASGLQFGSEVKAILAHPQIGVSVDLEGLLEYMTFQNFLNERTLFAGIKLLPPATILRVDLSGIRDMQTYWDFDFHEPSTQLSVQEYDSQCSQLFEQAVKRQLVSDVPIGSYLSGGMDSGSISAIAARENTQLKSFTVGFGLDAITGHERTFDERAAAELMSNRFQTEHYQMVLKAGDMERCMKDLVWHLEEPRVGQSYPNYYAANLASKFGKVVLGGTGGDELFGGYPWRYYRAVVNNNFDEYIDKYYLYWQRMIPNSNLSEIFAPLRNELRHVWTRDIFSSVFKNQSARLVKPEDYINHSLYFESKTFLHSLLVVEDKLSMAHGLESRVPFLDNDLVDFAMGLPVNMKLGNLGDIVRLNENEPGVKTRRYFQRTRDGKLILRRVMANYVPPEIVQAVKQGFSAPDESWFRQESSEFVRETIYAKNARLFDIIDRKATLKLVDEHFEGKSNRRLLIWSLLYLEHWLNCFLPVSSNDSSKALA